MHLRKATKSFPVLLCLLPSTVLAQSNGGDGGSSGSPTFLHDYIDFLNQSGYTSLSNALVQANQTQSGQAWLSKVEQQIQNEGGDVGSPWTVFAPNNQAFESVPDSITQNATLLSELLSYHFVYGNLQNTTASSGGGGGATSTSAGYSSTMASSSAPTSSGASQTSLSGSGVEPTGTGSPPSNPSAFAFHGPLNHNSSNSGPQLLSGVYPNVTIGRTLLTNDSGLVQLEGNKNQVLAWTRSGVNGNVTILNQPRNVTVVNAYQWRNFFIAEINGVLTPPGNVTTALTAVNDTPLLNFGSQIQVPLNNGSNGSAIEFLQEARGFTLFAPESEAFTNDINQMIQQLQGNQTALAALLQNHYINGSTVYSPTLMQLGVNDSSSNSSNSSTTYYSAAGEPFTFSYNSSAGGLFVGHASNPDLHAARVTRPDILVENGVIHLIDRVLFDTQQNSEAASSAYASATSAAAQTSTDAYAIGTSPIPAPAVVTNTAPTTESTPTATSSSSMPSSFRIRRGLNLPPL